MKKIFFVIIFVLLISFIQGANYLIQGSSLEIGEQIKQCVGCKKENKCYNVGDKLIVFEPMPFGTIGGIVYEGEPLTVGRYTINVIVLNSAFVKFIISSKDGVEKTDSLTKGDTEKLYDGNYLTVEDIIYESFTDGIQSALFYIKDGRYSINFSWKSETFFYCNDSKQFALQKITGETCENDFECQSDKCSNKKCERKQGIKITTIYEDKKYIIKNLFFNSDEIFYFEGLRQNYSIGFGKTNEDFVFFINNKPYNMHDKFVPDSRSYFILNGILFNNGIVNANMTFVEIKPPIEDIEKLIEEITCDGLFVNEECKKEGESFEVGGIRYIVENKTAKEMPPQVLSITGATIEGKGNLFGFLERIKQFFKNLFNPLNAFVIIFCSY